MHARQRKAQRSRQCRAVATPSHVLRNARQFLLRRLFQERCDRLRVGAVDGSVAITAEASWWPRSSPATRPCHATAMPRNSGSDSCLPIGSSSSAWPTTSGPWATPGRADAVRRSTTFEESQFPCRCRAVPGCRLLVRSLCRDLEQRLHGVRSASRWHPDTAAGPLHRYGHGPGTDRRRAAGQGIELRHRPLSSADRADAIADGRRLWPVHERPRAR